MEGKVVKKLQTSLWLMLGFSKMEILIGSVIKYQIKIFGIIQ